MKALTLFSCMMILSSLPFLAGCASDTVQGRPKGDATLTQAPGRPSDLDPNNATPQHGIPGQY
jgi:hypothetical protein